MATQRMFSVMILLLGFSTCAVPASAVIVRESPFEITGFMDVLFSTDEVTAGERDFRLGQAELDFFACTSDHSCACVAVAYDPATGTFGLGAATIEFLIAGKGSDCRHHYEKWERSGLVVGQFDIPFGIDWLTYPSVDRRTVTAPDAIDATHDGWNELGASFFVEATRYTARAWVTNGFDAMLWEDEDVDHVHLRPNRQWAREPACCRLAGSRSASRQRRSRPWPTTRRCRCSAPMRRRSAGTGP
ncbi:MAG: hypothetical protein IPI48_07745 [bacterium]|nr:hypothetical protein [bacterium]